MIDKAYLVGQMESFEAQEQQLVAQLQQVSGAKRLCLAMIGKVERDEDEAKKAKPAAQPADATT